MIFYSVPFLILFVLGVIPPLNISFCTRGCPPVGHYFVSTDLTRPLGHNCLVKDVCRRLSQVKYVISIKEHFLKITYRTCDKLRHCVKGSR